LAERIFAAGVVGAGGAGFPTHKKLAAGIRLLVVNAAECEPLLASDRYLMRHASA
jgi:Na+-translocating ferredoxin:NAD+ oxidoreductase RnfC subunit